MYAQQSYISHSVPPVQSSDHAANIGPWSSASGTSAIPAGGPWSHQTNLPSSGPLPDSTLPPGWVKQWDQRYQTWFFVNTLAQPPLSQWIHPASPASNQLLPGNAGACSQQSAPYRGPDLVGHQTNGHTGYMAAAHSAVLPNASHEANVPPGNLTQLNTKGIVNPSNRAVQNSKPAGSSIVTAGISALGGFAMGAFMNQERREQQRRERERENEAYAAGIRRGERERNYREGLHGDIRNGVEDSPDDVPQDADNADGSYDQVAEDEEDDNDW